MMKKYKVVMKFIVAVILLVLIPWIPTVASTYQDNNLIGRLRVETIKKEREEEIQTSNLSIIEKIGLINNYVNKKDSMIVTSQVQDMSNQNIALIKEIINEQIKILQESGLLVGINLDDSYTCYEFVLGRYNDVVNTNRSVSLYQVSFMSDSGYFRVWFDKETNKIFKFNYSGKQHSEVDVDIFKVFGVDYLGLSIDEVNEYLISYNEIKNNFIYMSMIDVNK